MSALFINAVGD